jgi:signal transduction histidine kinase
VAERLTLDVLASLLGLLAHDLRNPLSALQSNVSYLMAALPPTAQSDREAFQDALVSCDSLVNIIDSVQLLSQSLRKGAHYPVEPVSVAAVVADVVARHRALAASHGTAVRIEPSASDQRLQAVCNRDMYARALANLVRNCIQYSRPGIEVVVVARQGDGRCRIVVADSGPGLSEQCVASAFSAHGQVVARSQPHGRYGRGLGLYCARVAAELAGAEVRACPPPPPATNAFELAAPRA